MRITIFGAMLVASILALVGGCGQGSAPQLDPEEMKERQQAYESKMRDGVPRRGQSSNR